MLIRSLVEKDFYFCSKGWRGDNNCLCFEGVVFVARSEGARLGAARCDDVFLKPSSSVSGLVVSWARWISSFLLHWKHKAVASAPSEFGSGCFKPFKITANFFYSPLE